jgi:hypothetical protein
MARAGYPDLTGFKNVFLEDSWVLGIETTDCNVEFVLEAVILQSHQLYVPPPPKHMYCYRKAKLRFENVETLKWLEKTLRPYGDTTKGVDYGNIDSFWYEDKYYYLEGDWGKLEITSLVSLILEIGELIT